MIVKIEVVLTGEDLVELKRLLELGSEDDVLAEVRGVMPKLIRMAKQGDERARKLFIHLLKEGEVYLVH